MKVATLLSGSGFPWQPEPILGLLGSSQKTTTSHNKRHFYCSQHLRNTKVCKNSVPGNYKEQIYIYIYIAYYKSQYQYSVNIQFIESLCSNKREHTGMFSSCLFPLQHDVFTFLLMVETFYHIHKCRQQYYKTQVPAPVVIDIWWIFFTCVLLFSFLSFFWYFLISL